MQTFLTATALLALIVRNVSGCAVHTPATSTSSATSSTTTTSTTTTTTTTSACSVTVNSALTGNFGGATPTCTGTTCAFATNTATLTQANGCTDSTFSVITSAGGCTTLDNGGQNGGLDTGAPTSFLCRDSKVFATVTAQTDGSFTLSDVTQIECGNVCGSFG